MAELSGKQLISTRPAMNDYDNDNESKLVLSHWQNSPTALHEKTKIKMAILRPLHMHADTQ